MALLDSIKTYKKMLIEIDEPITDKVIAVQEDAESRYLDVQLFKSGVPIDLTGAKVRIYMDKPDGTKIMNDGEITDPTSGRCQFKLTTQALAACGNLRTQIKGFSESEEQILSTQIFDIKVTESLLTNETIESTNEYGSLVILFQDIYEALQIMTAIKNNFGEPGETAGTVPATTFWQMLEAVYNVNADALKNASVSEVLNRIGESTDESGTQTLFGRIGQSDDTAEDKTLFGNTNLLIEYTKENTTQIFNTVKMKKEVATVNVPSGSGTYTGTFNFSKGKKKIKAIIFKSSGFQATSGTYIFEVDGTEYKFSTSDDTSFYIVVFVELMADDTSSRVLDFSANASTPSYKRNPIRLVVKDSFSVTMPIKRAESSGKANMIIFYE